MHFLNHTTCVNCAALTWFLTFSVLTVEEFGFCASHFIFFFISLLSHNFAQLYGFFFKCICHVIAVLTVIMKKRRNLLDIPQHMDS